MANMPIPSISESDYDFFSGYVKDWHDYRKRLSDYTSEVGADHTLRSVDLKPGDFKNYIDNEGGTADVQGLFDFACQRFWEGDGQ